MQDKSVNLMEHLALSAPEDAAWIRDLPKWAHSHRKVITRFGRFPHRNAILGREDTAEEAAFRASDEPKF